MDPRTSKRIFFILFFSFFLLGPSFVLYAYGWRIDTRSMTPTRVGGMLLRGIAGDDSLTINGQPPMSRPEKALAGYVVKNLLPGDYEVVIARSGHHQWRKMIRVEPATVAETRPLIFVPVKPEEAPVLSGIWKDFWISGNNIAHQGADGTVYLSRIGKPESRTNISLMFNSLKEKNLNFPGQVPIASLAATDNPGVWIINTAKSSYRLDVDSLEIDVLQEKYRPADIPLPELNLPERGAILSVSGYEDPDHVFIEYPGRLFLLEVDNREPLNLIPIAEKIKKYRYSGGKVYLLRDSGITSFGL